MNHSSDISCSYLFNIFILKLCYIWDIKCQILKVVIDFRMNYKSSCDLACDFSMVNKFWVEHVDSWVNKMINSLCLLFLVRKVTIMKFYYQFRPHIFLFLLSLLIKFWWYVLKISEKYLYYILGLIMRECNISKKIKYHLLHFLPKIKIKLKNILISNSRKVGS